jgi:hypothetical protein
MCRSAVSPNPEVSPQLCPSELLFPRRAGLGPTPTNLCQDCRLVLRIVLCRSDAVLWRVSV